jgi:hypothetical protein
VQTVEGFFPETAIDEVVPLGDEVVDRATTPQFMQRAP